MKIFVSSNRSARAIDTDWRRTYGPRRERIEPPGGAEHDLVT